MSNTCTIYLLNNHGVLEDRRFCSLLYRFQRRLETSYNYRRPRLSKLLSRMLLLYASPDETRLGTDTLQRLQYSPFGKPFWPGGPYFSISHSADLTAIAVSDTLNIGLDIQQIAPIEEGQMRIFLHKNEFASIRCYPPPQRPTLLTDLWTKKEAIGKLLECGLGVGFRNIDTTFQQGARLDNEMYCLSEISCPDGYCGHLAFRHGETLNIKTIPLTATTLMEKIEPRLLPTPEELLPHRELMLLVDAIEEYQAGISLSAKKYIDHDNPFFSGHFPGNAMMPGVILVEMMFQTAGLFVRMERLNTAKSDTVKSPPQGGRAIKITDVVFREAVRGGTALVISVTLKQKLRSFYTFQAFVSNGANVFAQGEITIYV